MKICLAISKTAPKAKATKMYVKKLAGVCSPSQP